MDDFRDAEVEGVEDDMNDGGLLLLGCGAIESVFGFYS